MFEDSISALVVRSGEQNKKKVEKCQFFVISYYFREDLDQEKSLKVMIY